MRQRPQSLDDESARDQDVIERALRLPARERSGRIARPGQCSALVEQVEFLAARGRVEIAHQDRVFLFADQFGEERELARARGRPQREVGDHHDQRIGVVAEACPQCAAAGNASGQWIVEDFVGLPDDLTLGRVRVDPWGGFVFVNLDANAEPLLDYLDPLPALLAPYHLEQMRLRASLSTIIDANWKAVVDAFNEGYHVQGLHRQILPWTDDVSIEYEQYLVAECRNRGL